MLGSCAGQSLWYTAQRIETDKELQKLDLQDNNNNLLCVHVHFIYLFTCTIFLQIHVHFFAKTNEICTLNPARLCWKARVLRKL